MQNYKFAPIHRLLKADEFSSVFLFRKVCFGKYLKVYFKPNTQNNSRLGLVVSKKVHKRANKRNYMKRVLREFFRHNNALWNNYDIIVRVHKCFVQADYILVNAELTYLTQKFKK